MMWVLIGIGVLFVVLVIIATKNVLHKRKQNIQLFALNLGLPERLVSMVGPLEKDILELNVWNTKQCNQIWDMLEIECNLNRSDLDKSRARLRFTLAKLWSVGTIGFSVNPNYYDRQLAVKDMIAFDSARYVELVRQGVALGLLEEDEAWMLLFINAQRVQAYFDNWSAYIFSYLKGRTLFLETTNQSKDLPKFSNKLNRMCNESENTLNDIPWCQQRVFQKTIISKNQ